MLCDKNHGSGTEVPARALIKILRCCTICGWRCSDRQHTHLLQALSDRHEETPLASSPDETEAFVGSTGNAVEVYGLQKLFHRPSRW